MQYALPSDEERYAMLSGSGMYGDGASQSMPSGSGGYYSQPYKPKPEPKKYGSWQDAMTAEEMKTIGDDILDEEGNPTGKKVYGDWRTAALPSSWRADYKKPESEPRYAGSGGGITGIPGGGLLSDEDRYSLLTGSSDRPSGTSSYDSSNYSSGYGLSSDEGRYALLTGSGGSPSGTSSYDSSNYSSGYGLSSDEGRYALLTGSGDSSSGTGSYYTPGTGSNYTSEDDGFWSGGSRDFDESTGTYRPGYRGLSSDEDRYALLTGSGGSSGYTPSNYSLSGLSSGLSSDEDRYKLLGSSSYYSQPKNDDEMINFIGNYERDGYYW